METVCQLSTIFLNFCYTPSHRWGCCKAKYKCPCFYGGNLPRLVDELNPKFKYEKHYDGCNLRGSNPCDCWKYTPDDPNGALLETTQGSKLAELVITRRNLAYENEIADYIPSVPYVYWPRTKDVPVVQNIHPM